MALYRAIIPFTNATDDGASPARPRYTSIQVAADSDAEAKRMAVVEFEEMAKLSRQGHSPRADENNIRLERAPVTPKAKLTVSTAMLSPQVAAARLTGAVNSHSFTELQQALDTLKSKGVARLVLDLSGLSYINSTGMSLFVAAGDLFDLRLAAVPARITRLFRMIGLDELFPTFISVAEAAKAQPADPSAGALLR